MYLCRWKYWLAEVLLMGTAYGLLMGTKNPGKGVVLVLLVILSLGALVAGFLRARDTGKGWTYLLLAAWILVPSAVVKLLAMVLLGCIESDEERLAMIAKYSDPNYQEENIMFKNKDQ